MYDGENSDYHVYEEMTPPGGYALEIGYIRNKNKATIKYINMLIPKEVAYDLKELFDK